MNDINALREQLFKALRGVSDGTMNIETAKAISDIGQTIINSAKVEVDFIKANGGGDGSGFIPIDGNTLPDSLPPGTTGIHQYKLK